MRIDFIPPPKDPEKLRLWKERLSSAHKNAGYLKSRWDDAERRKELIASRVNAITIESREKQKNAALDLWKDKEFRDKNIASRKIVYSDPDYKQKIGKILKERFKDPALLKRMCEITTKRYENEDEILKLTERLLGGFWYGNVRYYYGPLYCDKWNESLRERVRAYWGYKCVECGVHQNGKKLNVHHVHYNKKTCCDGSPHDMVPLCPSCHAKTNYNRRYWEQHFTEMIYTNDPTGKCFFTKDEMTALHHPAPDFRRDC